MLRLVLPANEKTATLFSLPAPAENIKPAHVWAAQAHKRQEIIDKLVKECPYKVGDTVKPYTLAEQNIHGLLMRVETIVTSYAQIRLEQWPDNDTPKIVHAMCLESGVRFHCTPAYLIPLARKEADAP